MTTEEVLKSGKAFIYRVRANKPEPNGTYYGSPWYRSMDSTTMSERTLALELLTYPPNTVQAKLET